MTVKESKRINTKKLIVQIGRLDRFYLEPINFNYEGKKGESNLSSTFLMENTDLNDAKRLIIFPSSIILQDALLSVEGDSFIDQVKKINVDEYLKNPEETLKFHPQAVNSNLLAVSSLGYYSFQRKEYPFEGSLDLITLQIYLFILSQYEIDGLQEIYIDISSGQNIYISALISALYRLLPFVKFKKFFKTDAEVLGWILNADPIMGKPLHSIEIRRSIFNAKAFNTLVYKDFEPLLPLLKKIFKPTSYYSEIIDLFRTEYFILHGGIIKGAPLMISLANLETLNFLFENIGISKIIKRLYTHYKSVENSQIGLEETSQIFVLSFALVISESIYYHFSKVINEMKMILPFKNEKDGISIGDNDFKEAYEILREKFSQPITDYQGEIKKMADIYFQHKKDGFVSFSDLKLLENPDYKANDSFNSRNYFAHGGLELNVTEMKIDESSILVKYNERLNDKNRANILKYLKKN